MKYSYDIVIIGAGIGGLSVAHLLGSHNLRVALIDEEAVLPHVTFHTLGSFSDYQEYGLSSNVIAAKQTECIFHSRDLHIRKTGIGYIIHKQNLYQELLDKAENAHVDIYPKTHMQSFTQDAQGNIQSIIDDTQNIFEAQVFIDATGAAGVISRKLGLLDKTFAVASGLEYNVAYTGPSYQTHLFIGNFYQGGYGWIFPLGNGRAILGYGSFHNDGKHSIKERLDNMFTIPHIQKLVQKDNDTLHGGTIPITDVKTTFVSHNVVCIGDSVSQVNPLVGEGHRFILDAGKMAAPYIIKAIQEHNMAILHGYEDAWKTKYLQDYQWSKTLQIHAYGASRNDFLTDLGVLWLATKRNKTFSDLLAGHITMRRLLLP